MNILAVIGVVIAVILFFILKEVVGQRDDAYNLKIRERNDTIDKENARRLKEEFGGDKEAMQDYDQVQWENSRSK